MVASPTYKAAYTGLLKLFLDQFDHDELAGVPTVALMTGGSPAHALAVEVHLRPVLVEIGASLPTRGVFLAGPEVDDPDRSSNPGWPPPPRRSAGRWPEAVRAERVGLISLGVWDRTGRR